MAHGLTLILYTTRYREGGERFAQVARTMAQEKTTSGHTVRCVAVESKADFQMQLARVEASGDSIRELHFVGHSGMYGIMFGTRAWPQQFSPHEWRSMRIPFAPDGAAFFHACRTARWFAPFFADTFRVPTYGYHWYTTFSRESGRYARLSPLTPPTAPLYVFGCPGLKSHGPTGSVRKLLGMTPPEGLKRFEPSATAAETSYDPVADLYADTFQDITVRRDEWAFLRDAVTRYRRKPTVLDVGCGNGALLDALAPHIDTGLGVDASAAMIAHAATRQDVHRHLRFAHITEPRYPLADDSVDVAISLLSFRYLDWDPTLDELHRVLRPGGRLLVVDMVERPLSVRETPRVMLDKLRELRARKQHPQFTAHLSRMVQDPRWQHMLRYNPIRSDHELRWYLQSRFPQCTFRTLNRSRRAQIVAFDSGPIFAAARSPFVPMRDRSSDGEQPAADVESP